MSSLEELDRVVKVIELFRDLERAGRVKVHRGENREIKGLAVDTRGVKPGDLFAALEGPNRDGHHFVGDAVKAGATALLVEEGKKGLNCHGERTALIGAVSVRDVLGNVSDLFYGHPSGPLDLFGVTGTNGKTSVTYLLEGILKMAGKKPGVIGTVDYRWGGSVQKAPSTTPESVDLQRVLREMADDGVETVAMEVSSHALEQHRVRGCEFRTAIFTNLGRDHLDFHRDLEDYFLAKQRLFGDYLPEASIVNADDPWGRRLLEMVPGSISFSCKGRGDYTAHDIRSDTSGSRFRFRGGGRDFKVSSSLTGAHNVSNILAAAAAACEYGLESDHIRVGIEATEIIPGRFEKVSGAGEPTVLIDYAHTADALEHALNAARNMTNGSLRLVFGCGGDRDRGKRPLMGRVAARLADVTYLTSDNPRSEEPEAILEDVLTGYREELENSAVLHVIPDRRRAIKEAVIQAGPEDVVLIAGKGHEDYQMLAGGTVPFSDRKEARTALRERRM